MGFETEVGIFLAYTAGLLGIYFFGKVLILPLKLLGKLLINSLAGGAALLVLGLLGSHFGIVLPVNIVTAMMVGVTGLPGVIGILCYFNLLV